MSDEHLYLRATKEVESENRDSALWAKAVALKDGDTEKAKFLYVRLRVEQLAAKQDESIHEDAPNHRSNIKPNHSEIPAEQYAEHYRMSEDQVIELVKKGQLKGREVSGSWYVSVTSEKPATDRGKKQARRQASSGSRLMPIKQYADLYRLSETQVVSLIKTGRLRGRHVNNNYYVYVEGMAEPDSNGHQGRNQAKVIPKSSSDVSRPDKTSKSAERKVIIVMWWLAVFVGGWLFTEKSSPYVSGIDFVTTTLGGVFGVVAVSLLLNGLVALMYKFFEQRKMPYLDISIPVVAAIGAFIALYGV